MEGKTMTELQPVPLKAADATEPGLIPASFTAAWPYADGKYKWTPAQSARFEWIAHITVTGDPAAAAYARVQDVERFDAAPAQFPGFAQRRLDMGHSCGIAYTQLDDDPTGTGGGVGEVVRAMAAARMGSDPWLLWVAWWWRKDVAPTQAIVHQQLVMLGVDIPIARIAACQWRNGPFDESVIYQPHIMHRPQGWPS